MLKYWQVEVVTTCARDYLTWENCLTPGRSDIQGVSVMRFPVTKARDMESFARLSAAVFASPTAELEEEWAQAQGPDCPQLLEYLTQVFEKRDLFVFFSYLYSHSSFGLPLVHSKAVLVPMAHEEPPLRLSLFSRVFCSPRYLLFNTLEEQKLIESRFPLEAVRRKIVGVGLSESPEVPDERIREEVRKLGPYCLYVGRIDYPKGVGELLHYFVHQDSDLLLLLAGERHFEIPNDRRVVYLGEISDAVKRTLIQEAAFVVLPSPFESLSMSFLETLAESVPVLANGHSNVLAGQVERSGAGLVYRSQAEFASQARHLAASSARRARMGLIGKRFVLANYNWPTVERKYLEALQHVQT